MHVYSRINFHLRNYSATLKSINEKIFNNIDLQIYMLNNDCFYLHYLNSLLHI